MTKQLSKTLSKTLWRCSPANLEQVLQCIKVNKASVDLYSFELETSLWREVKGLEMPLPPLKGILPLVIAIWNSIKGGSDATTNLLWRCKGDPPPQRTNQAAVVARMLSLSVVTVHRLFQIIGCRKISMTMPTFRISKSQLQSVQHTSKLYSGQSIISLTYWRTRNGSGKQHQQHRRPWPKVSFKRWVEEFRLQHEGHEEK